MAAFALYVICLSVLIRCFLCFTLQDQFNEELYLKPLPSGHVYAYFQFTTVWNASFEAQSFQHCHLFPRALGEILGQYNVQELHLSLTEGLWRHEKFGYPFIDAPPGAELLAWFKENTDNVDKTWQRLTSALSGLFCASLNFVDSSNSLSPTMSFAPTGAVTKNLAQNSTLVRYATLPREVVCTENLTPWKKLLPCDSKKGLATLLNAGHIYNTNYHSLGVHVRPVCRDLDCEETSIELRQTVSLIYDTLTVGSGTRDWSLRKLFGSGLSSACPLASQSRIFVDVSQNKSSFAFNLTPNPSDILRSIRGGSSTQLALYDLKKMHLISMLNVVASYIGDRVEQINVPPVLFANRYIIGYGQEYGGIVTQLHNTHWQPLVVVYMENIPWFLPVYLHTFTAYSGGQRITPIKMHFVPGRERKRPYQLEVALRIPPRSVTTLTINFDYIFLKWQEYPPDANHGFYVGSAVITSYLPIARNYTGIPQDGSTIISSMNASRSEGYLLQLRTETLLVSLPTPDFSMPYNVICLACTVVALAFGPLHNITTKRLLMKDIEQRKGLISWIKSKFKRDTKAADTKSKED